MAKRKGASTSGPRPRSKAAKEGREAKEAGNAQRLDKLPQEVWDNILDELEEDDLFPLALSCRYFRQKQKELVARTRQSGRESGKPRLALRTNLERKLDDEDQPASAEYLRFCYKEKVSKDFGHKRTKVIRELAAYRGYLPLLQELLESSEALQPNLLHIAYSAASGGQLKTLQWLKTQEGFKLDFYALSLACKSGHLEVSKWLRSEGCPWDWRDCHFAAQGGHFQLWKWSRSEGCPLNKWACWSAAEHGHLEILKWLRSEGCPWDEDACNRAAEEGHLEILKWLRSEGCPWDEDTCWMAAGEGHLDVLKWLRSEGCPWNVGACNSAAGEGHLECLKWLRSEGCPWDARACAGAALDGHLDVLQWAIDNGCPYVVTDRTRRAYESLGLA